MKTSILDMTFVLPPMVEMVQVEKEMPDATFVTCGGGWLCQENTMKTSIFDMRQIGSQQLQDSPLRWAIFMDSLYPVNNEQYPIALGCKGNSVVFLRCV